MQWSEAADENHQVNRNILWTLSHHWRGLTRLLLVGEKKNKPKQTKKKNGWASPLILHALGDYATATRHPPARVRQYPAPASGGRCGACWWIIPGGCSASPDPHSPVLYRQGGGEEEEEEDRAQKANKRSLCRDPWPWLWQSPADTALPSPRTWQRTEKRRKGGRGGGFHPERRVSAGPYQLCLVLPFFFFFFSSSRV